MYAEVAYADMATQARQFVMGKQSMPPDAAFCDRRSFALVHAIRGRALPLKCWQVIRHMSDEVAARSKLKLEPFDQLRPWLWRSPVP